jgi:UrcA family protein
MNMTPKLVAGALAAIVGVSMVESIVGAHGSDEPRTISVRADDLDLEHVPDAEVLLARIADASITACGDIPDFRKARQVETFERCRRLAIQDAIRRLNQPMVTEIAATHTWPRRLAVR